MRVYLRLLRSMTLLLAATILFFGSCKKTRIEKDDKLDPVIPSTGDRTQLTRDSIYLYALQTYYWNASLPSYAEFDPRKYASNDDELFALTTFSLNPATGKNYEYVNGLYPKYSFIDDGTVADQLGGTGGNYGFSVAYSVDNNLYVKYVYASSSADIQGLKRGYQITKINGRTSLLRTSPADIDFINDAIFGSNATVDMTLKKPDGLSVDVTVSRVSYTINPVIYSTVFTSGAKKIGYFVFNSFTTNAATKLNDLMADFASQNVSELVVDLRYNGGGSVETAELLSNLIVPAASSGSTMYDTYFNTTMQNGHATILKNQKFKDNGVQHSYFEFDYSVAGNSVKFVKSGTLNVSRVYFIVTASTASASELLINNLKPAMDVKLIGRKTYGKPVGFFALHIHDFDMYIPQFETKNSLGVGGYYDGLTVDKEDNDDVTKEFGNPAEKLLSYALTYADKGVFSARNPKQNTISSAALDEANTDLEANQFKGMVASKFKIKK